MATPKTWTAADIKMGVIRLGVEGGILSAIQGYVFVDGSGVQIDQLPTKTVQQNIPFADLPENIQTALIDINNYMYQKALQNEDME